MVTWGDERGSVQRNHDPRIKTAWIDKSVPLNESMLANVGQRPVILTERQREIVNEAIVEVCAFREYFLQAANVRSNHAHVVVSKAVRPEKIVNDFKAYATRKLRAENEIRATEKVWSRGASTRYLWKPRHVVAAIDYVLYSQGDIPFELD